MSLRIKDSMAGSVSGSVTGNAGTATKLQTSRTLTVGSTGKTFDGSANVSWSLSEIGAAASSHTHNYAGSSSAGGAATSALTCTGNSATATKLATARTINGTNFDGSAAITTANWGTARTLTIGSTGKSVNGSANVSWSLSEIGAAAASHTHNAIVSRGSVTAESGVTARPAVAGLSMTQAYNNGYPTSYGNVISLRGTGDGQILVGWSGTDGAHAPVYVRSKRDNTTSANWSGWAQFYTSANPQTTITGNAGTATTLQTARTINGTSFNGSANITTANWGTARTLTIGSTGKSVNGSANVSWSLSEIGAASSSSVGTLSSLQTTAKTNLVAAINEVFQSVSNGKSSIAQAITSKGVSASSSDTFSNLATKIKNIPVKKYDSGQTITKGTHYSFPNTIAEPSGFPLVDDMKKIYAVSANCIFVSDGYYEGYFYRYDTTKNSYVMEGGSSESDIFCMVDGYCQMDYSDSPHIHTMNSYYDTVYPPVMSTPINMQTFNTITGRILEDGKGNQYYVNIAFGVSSSTSAAGPPMPQICYEFYKLSNKSFTSIAKGSVMSPEEPYSDCKILSDGSYLLIELTQVYLLIDIANSTFTSISKSTTTTFLFAYDGYLYRDVDGVLYKINLKSGANAGTVWLSSYSHVPSSSLQRPIIHDNTMYIPTRQSSKITEITAINLSNMTTKYIQPSSTIYEYETDIWQVHGKYPTFANFTITPDYNTIKLI